MLRYVLTLMAFLTLTPAQAAEVREVSTQTGLKFWLVEEHSIPMISIEVSFEGGHRLDPPELAGRAMLFTSTLEEGAGPYDAAGFARAAGQLAARYSFESGREAIGISAAMLADKAEASVALLRLALAEPRFAPESVDLVRGQILALQRQRQTNADAIAGERFNALRFGDHPYGRDPHGTPETLARLDSAALKAAHARYFHRGNVLISVVGAVDATRAAALVETLLGWLPPGSPPERPMINPAFDGQVVVVDFEAPQSTILFGHAGILRNDPDYIPAYVMNYILGGGGFVSRLTEEVREKRGLAYGVYSYLNPLQAAGLYMGGVATANERAGETIGLIRAEWQRMAEQGVGAEELSAAKRYLTGAWALQFDSNAKIADFLIGAQRAGLGRDYITTRNALIEAVSAADIARVAKRLLRPGQLSFVVVGKPKL